MATLKIDEIHTQSIGGWAVVLTGVAPTDGDCIIGSVDTPGLGKIHAVWDLHGTHRGGVPDSNLNTSDEQVSDLIGLAKQLGAT